MRKESSTYRKAIELDPDPVGARAQLGVNLMRLGEEKEAREQLEVFTKNGYRNAADDEHAHAAGQLQEFRHLQDATPS